MAQEDSRFFDSVESDKQYSADQFAEYFRTFMTSGVFEFGTNLQVSALSGMNVQVGYGAAIVHGYGYWLKDDNNGVQQLSIGAAGAQPRIDRVVLRLDRSVGTRSIILAVKAGTPGSSPVAPDLEREGNIYEISLARIAVGANVTSINSGNITDERTDNSVCGRVEPAAVRDYINQSVKTTDSPTFSGLTVTNTITANKVIGAVYQ